MDLSDLPYFKDVDILQVGARNMQNFALLKELSKLDKPILLKRGLSATYEEWLMSAEYLMSGGNDKIILCERGIRTLKPAPATPWTFPPSRFYGRKPTCPLSSIRATPPAFVNWSGLYPMRL